MLKDNHIASCGNVEAAVKKAKSVAGFALKIEVECRNQQEAEEAIIAGTSLSLSLSLSMLSLFDVDDKE
jgi:nicotinate-nucleotide pyrophosphorylase (carboxylating)